MTQIDYKIRAFDPDAAQIVVEIIGYFTVAIDLPIDEEGRAPVGEDLDHYIRGFIPPWEIERREKILRGIANADEIAALVEPWEGEESEPPPLSAFRDRMTLLSFDLARRLLTRGLLSSEEALSLVRDRALPRAFEEALSLLAGEEEAALARFDLFANRPIARLSAFARNLSVTLDIDDDALDRIFIEDI